MLKIRFKTFRDYLPQTVSTIDTLYEFNKNSEYGTPYPQANISTTVKELERMAGMYSLYKFLTYGLSIALVGILIQLKFNIF
jgi:hypothetical protein